MFCRALVLSRGKLSAKYHLNSSHRQSFPCQVTLFCLAIGRDPTGMTLAVVNDEVPGLTCSNYTDGCILGSRDGFFGDFDFDTRHKANLSCRYKKG